MTDSKLFNSKSDYLKHKNQHQHQHSNCVCLHDKNLNLNLNQVNRCDSIICDKRSVLSKKIGFTIQNVAQQPQNHGHVSSSSSSSSSTTTTTTTTTNHHFRHKSSYIRHRIHRIYNNHVCKYK